MIKPFQSVWHIVAYPTAPGDFGLATISGIEWSPGAEQRAAEALLVEAKQHLTLARGARQYIFLRSEFHYRCNHCGAIADKKADLVGCCEADVAERIAAPEVAHE